MRISLHNKEPFEFFQSTTSAGSPSRVENFIWNVMVLWFYLSKTLGKHPIYQVNNSKRIQSITVMVLYLTIRPYGYFIPLYQPEINSWWIEFKLLKAYRSGKNWYCILENNFRKPQISLIRELAFLMRKLLATSVVPITIHNLL